jgi:hypothetical protein
VRSDNSSSGEASYSVVAEKRFQRTELRLIEMYDSFITATRSPHLANGIILRYLGKNSL